ncbi:uncharacterized protein [Littorina saxatilis]
MEDPARLRREYQLAVLQHQHDLIDLTLYQVRANRPRRRRGERGRRNWVRPWIGRRRQFGMYDQLMVELRNEDHASFTNFLRTSPAMFDELLARDGPRITKQYTFYRDPLEPGMKPLALTLRPLASGNKYASLDEVRMEGLVPHNTQSLVVRDVCQAIIDEYVDEMLVCPSTPEGWRAVADKFFQRWNFPNTCGALDGKHVACRCPPKSGSLYFNYKGFYSIVLMALVDADYKFIWADIGGTGSASDAQIYNFCELKECVEDGTLGFPDPEPLPNDNQDVSYCFIGDDALGPSPTMMKPYSLRGLTNEKRISNYRLSRARRVVENAFHPPVVGLLDVPNDRVLAKEIAHDLLFFNIKTKRCLLGPLSLGKGWLRRCPRCTRGVGTCSISIRG